MDQYDAPDPFVDLQEWAAKTERRVKRELPCPSSPLATVAQSIHAR